MVGKEIKYTIDNFSGILDVSWDNLPTNKRIGVYFLYGENKEILYIGKSVSTMRGRLSNHLFVEEPSPYNELHNKIVLDRRKRVKYFSFIDVPKNYIDMVERYLICEHQCEFNTQFKYDMVK
jgi:excinuclease UvrABC nuclease subunit